MIDILRGIYGMASALSLNGILLLFFYVGLSSFLPHSIFDLWLFWGWGIFLGIYTYPLYKVLCQMDRHKMGQGVIIGSALSSLFCFVLGGLTFF